MVRVFYLRRPVHCSPKVLRCEAVRLVTASNYVISGMNLGVHGSCTTVSVSFLL